MLAESAPPVVSFGTSIPPQHAGLSEDTFGLFNAFGRGGEAAVMAAAPTTRITNNNESVTCLVDSAAFGQYLDTSLESGILAGASGYTALDKPFKVETGEINEEEAVASVITRGTVTDRDEKPHHVAIFFAVVPGLRRHLFSVEVATNTDIITALDQHHSRLETASFVLALEQSKHDKDLYMFRMHLSDYAEQRPGMTMHVAASANIRHRRPDHVGPKSLETLRKVDVFERLGDLGETTDRVNDFVRSSSGRGTTGA